EALVGELRERTGLVVCTLGLTSVLTVLEVGSEVEADRAECRRIHAADRGLPAGVDEGGIVDRFVEDASLQNPAVILFVVGEEGDAETAIVAETVVDRSTLHKRCELGAGHRLEARE